MTQKTIKYLVMSTITLLFFAWLNKSNYIAYIDYKVYDFFTKKLDIHKKEKDNFTPSVIIVDIDQKSINSLGQWPWPRIITANLINKINRHKPSTIGLNMMFRTQDKSSIISLQKFYNNYLGYDIKISGLDKELFDNDKLLKESLTHTKSILPVYLQTTQENNISCKLSSLDIKNLKNATTDLHAGSILCNIDEFHDASYYFGFINTTIDKDGILRRTPLFVHFDNTIITSFALANLLSIDKNIEFPSKHSINILGHNIDMDSSSNTLLHFYQENKLKKVSAIDVLEETLPKDIFAGKIVLIGTSLISNSNQHQVSSGAMLSGTDISATTIENILNDHLLYQPTYMKHINLLLAFFFAIVSMVLLHKKLYQTLYLLYITVIVVSFMGSFLAFNYDIYTSIAYFWVPVSIHFLLIGFALIYINDIESKQYYKELSNSHSAALESMVFVAGTKDFETGEHLSRTKEYMKLLATNLKNKGIYKETLTDSFINLIYHSAPLHDIGKVGIPDAILQKPGKLTEDEYTVMKEHPKLGMQIISNAMQSNKKNDFLQTAYNIAYFHHEAWDGSGYPTEIKGNQIPLEARLMALVDVYDALTTKRCYKEPYSFEKSEDIIINESGRYFDPQIVEVFKHVRYQFREIATTMQ